MQSCNIAKSNFADYPSHMKRRRLFAGRALQTLRLGHGLNQAQMAERLGISASYLSQLEHDDRPLTNVLVERLASSFPLDWQDMDVDATERAIVALRDALSGTLFAEHVSAEQLVKIAEQSPDFARHFLTLHSAWTNAEQRLAMLDEALAIDQAGEAQLPWEEVRDWFNLANNYVDEIDRGAEALAQELDGTSLTPAIEQLEQQLRQRFGIETRYREGALRELSADGRQLHIDSRQPPESRRFQLAYQFVAVALVDEIAAIVEAARFKSATARRLLFVGLSNYAAGALIMPYGRFRREARLLRHDIDRLRTRFGSSFEQTCHRLSTLQRPGERGLPFFFCRVDMAGNITKRHSATRLQFARFGGACPLWIVHEAVAIPDRILVQLTETPDKVRYVSMAKGLVKPSDNYLRAPRRYAVALGCEVSDAAEFVYADGLDLASSRSVARIGQSCRICPRDDCDQRAFPPVDRVIAVDPDRRGTVPYEFTP